MAQASLTARETSRAGAKAGHSDPVVLNGRAIAQRIKGTPGITGLSPPRVHIDGEVWHLDVGSSHPGAGAGPKGMAVRHLKSYVSWVQNVVRQFGSYLPGVQARRRFAPTGTNRSIRLIALVIHVRGSRQTICRPALGARLRGDAGARARGLPLGFGRSGGLSEAL